MSDIIDEAVTQLSAKIGTFDGSVKFRVEDEGSIMMDQAGVREGDEEAECTMTRRRRDVPRHPRRGRQRDRRVHVGQAQGRGRHGHRDEAGRGAVLTGVEPAPYHAGVACGPPGERPVWIVAADGTRLRAVTWPRAEGARGTVVMLQGRTEYLEKYSDAARELGARGYATASVDFRGQGLSPRGAHGDRTGHVEAFGDFQLDVDALLALCAAQDMPRPWHLLAHSMGGLVGLRALSRLGAFRRAAFSAPMWGLMLPPHRRALGWAVSAGAAALGLGRRPAPGASRLADPAGAPFEGNLLTSDPAMFAWMKRQVASHPELALGGPSLGWVWTAFGEMHRLAREAAPDVPCLTFLGTEEAVVSPDAIHVRIGSWDGGRVEAIDGARHEVLMEGPAVRARVYDAIAAHLGG